MARELSFKAVEEAQAGIDDGAQTPAPSKSWRRRRETNPTVQMSVRMREDVYERFRHTAERERRSNGDMLERMLEVYLRYKKENRISDD